MLALAKVAVPVLVKVVNFPAAGVTPPIIVPSIAVAVKVPVEGTKLNFVDDVFIGKLPDVEVTQVG